MKDWFKRKPKEETVRVDPVEEYRTHLIYDTLKNSHYDVTVECINCRFRGLIFVRKGTPLHEIECIKCGTNQLRSLPIGEITKSILAYIPELPEEVRTNIENLVLEFRNSQSTIQAEDSQTKKEKAPNLFQ